MLGIGQCIYGEIIKAFVLDNKEEGVQEWRVIEKLQRRFGLLAEKAVFYYRKLIIQEELMV